MIRSEYIAGVSTIPPVLTAFLSRLGGKNPYGEDNYRLIFAESRFIKIAGEFNEWDPSIPVEDRRGFRKVRVQLKHPKKVYAHVEGRGQQVVSAQEFEDRLIPTGRRPMRTWVGIKETRRYSNQEGIILEKWHPAHQYGSRVAWESITLRDGTPILGPYPELGDYDAVVGPWTSMPSTADLEKAINYVEDQIENNRYSPSARVTQRLNQAVREAEQESAEFQREVVERIKQKTAHLMSSTLEAGRARSADAERIGVTSHIGN